MSSSTKYAACSAVFLLCLAACNSGPSHVERPPTAQVRVQLDAARQRVWLLTGAGLVVYDPATPDRVQPVPVREWRHIVAGPRACLPDLALGPNGEAVISSDAAPVLWRVDPETLSVTRHEPRLDVDGDREFGFTVLRYSPARGAYLAVSAARGTIWRIDRELRTAHAMQTVAPAEKDCGARANRLVRQFGILDK